MCKVRVSRFPHDNQQSNAVLLDGGEFVRRVTDALVVRDGDAAVATAVFEPLLVRAIRRKQIVVSLYPQASIGENLGKAFTKVAVGKLDVTQAARSYRTACSISFGVRS